jgi:hypothetical protein
MWPTNKEKRVMGPAISIIYLRDILYILVYVHMNKNPLSNGKVTELLHLKGMW